MYYFMFQIAVAQQHSIIFPNAISGRVLLSAHIEFVRLVEPIQVRVYGDVDCPLSICLTEFSLVKVIQNYQIYQM